MAKWHPDGDDAEQETEEKELAELADAAPGNWWTLDEDDPDFDDKVDYG